MQRLVQFLLFTLICLAISNVESAPSRSDKRTKQESKNDSQTYVKENSSEEKPDSKENHDKEKTRRPSSRTR
jgi:hypothetical protein